MCALASQQESWGGNRWQPLTHCLWEARSLQLRAISLTPRRLNSSEYFAAAPSSEVQTCNGRPGGWLGGSRNKVAGPFLNWRDRRASRGGGGVYTTPHVGVSRVGEGGQGRFNSYLHYEYSQSLTNAQQQEANRGEVRGVR